MVWLWTSLVLGTLFTAPTPRLRVPSKGVLVSLDTAHGGREDARWEDALTLRRDGRWQAGDRSGRLDRAELELVKTALARIDATADPLRETCRARPIHHERLRFGGHTLYDSVPCGVRWSAASADAARLIRDLTAPRTGPDAVLVRLDEAARRAGAWVARTVVYADGRWEGRAGSGRLTAIGLDALRDAIATAHWKLLAEDVVCEALPNRRLRLVAGDHRVEWNLPCSATPDPSIDEVLRHLGALGG